MWMIPRNIRKIEPWKICQIATLLDAAGGAVRDQALQDALYEELASNGLKCKRAAFGVEDAGGMRTYLAQLACLGLFWKDPTSNSYKTTRAGDELLAARDEAEERFTRSTEGMTAYRHDRAARELRKLAKELPDDCVWRYGNVAMKPYRERIDEVVLKVLASDMKVYDKYWEFEELLDKATFYGKRTLGAFKTLEREDMREIYLLTK